MGRRALRPRSRLARGRPRGGDGTSLGSIRGARGRRGRGGAGGEHAGGPGASVPLGPRVVATAESMPFDDGVGRRRRRGQRVPSLRPRSGDGGDPARPASGGALGAVLGVAGRGGAGEDPRHAGDLRPRRAGQAESAIAAAHRSWAEPPVAPTASSRSSGESSRGPTSCRPRGSWTSTRPPATSSRCRARRATRCWTASGSCRVRSGDARTCRSERSWTSACELTTREVRRIRALDRSG